MFALGLDAFILLNSATDGASFIPFTVCHACGRDIDNPYIMCTRDRCTWLKDVTGIIISFIFGLIADLASALLNTALLICNFNKDLPRKEKVAICFTNRISAF